MRAQERRKISLSREEEILLRLAEGVPSSLALVEKDSIFTSVDLSRLPQDKVCVQESCAKP
jgi:hypothetical protein